MGNFKRRALAFLLGMVFMLIVLAGGIGGAAYWAYKNLKLGKLGVGEGGSELSEWTVEDAVVFILDIVNDPQKFTIGELEKRGLNIESMFSDIIDFSSISQEDLESLKSLPFLTLFGEKGLYQADMGVLFLLMPKNAETGYYPIFSEGARSRLRQYTLGDFVYPSADGSSGAISILRSMKIGSIFSSAYDEIYANGDYTYTCADKGLNLFGDVQFGLFTAMMEGKQTDLGYEVMEGYLTNLQSKSLREIVASFGATDDATYMQNYDGLAILGDTTLGESFIWNEEFSRYELDTSKAISLGTVGSFMGEYATCTVDENCPVHDDVANCDGELYKEGVLAEETGLMKIMLTNLANKSVLELNGIEPSSLFEGVMLGEAFGYQASYPEDACPVDCDIEHEHVTYEYCRVDCDIEHEHNFYFVDENGYVGDMYNSLGNLPFEDALNGTLDIEGVIDDTTIGEVMGYNFNGESWVDDNGEVAKQETLSEKIFYRLYDKTVGGLSEVSFEEMVDGIKLADVLGYVKCTADENCPIDHTDVCGKKGPYWYKKTVEGDQTVYERASALYNALCDIELDELSSNPGVIDEKLRTLYVGDLMGYTQDGGVWTKTVGDSQVPLTALEGVMAEIGLGEILDGKFDLKGKIDELTLKDILDVEDNAILSLVGDTKIKNLSTEIESLKVGEIMGYSCCSGDIADCPVHTDASQSTICSEKAGKWFNKSNEQVTGIEAKVATLTVKGLSNDEFKNIIDNIVVSDVIDSYDSGAFGLVGESQVTEDVNGDGKKNAGDVKVKDIASVVSNSIKSATFHDLLDAELLDEKDEDNDGKGDISQKLDERLPLKNPETGEPLWWSYNITEIIEALLEPPVTT